MEGPTKTPCIPDPNNEQAPTYCFSNTQNGGGESSKKIVRRQGASSSNYLTRRDYIIVQIGDRSFRDLLLEGGRSTDKRMDSYFYALAAGSGISQYWQPPM